MTLLQRLAAAAIVVLCAYVFLCLVIGPVDL